MRSRPAAARAQFSRLSPAILLLVGALGATEAGAQGLTVPDTIDAATLARIETAVDQAIRQKDLPGAVVLVWHRGQTVYREAFGHRAVVPVTEPMTLDTVFDLASLTKVIATTTAIMILVEEGRVRLRDHVDQYLPGFARHRKGGITIQHLLTHTSGLRPDFPLDEVFSGRSAALARAIDERPLASPGRRFIYSDINFVILGEVVARASGMPLDDFVETRVFAPLEMRDTGYGVSPGERARVAPTQACRRLEWPCDDPDAPMLRGVVHDPTARRMGGVAGHAGLFSTAKDLARFCAMLLSGGEVDGMRVLSPMSVSRMTRPATPPTLGDQRGLGWDIDSRYSSNRGELFSGGSYGHTGFTGTSMWLDPGSQTAVIVLSNRVHPDGGGSITALRGRIATLAAAAIRQVDVGGEAGVDVLTGVDRLEEESFAALRGLRVGLLTNQTGRNRRHVSTIDLLHEAPEVELRRVFSPEHGVRGDLDAVVEDQVDPSTGLAVHSLYGETRRPAAASLDGLDVVVVDLQDVGTRFYTYATTMAYMMEAAAGRGLRVVVLDRPNPITGGRVEGPLLDASARGFTGYHSMPVRHGLTLGELARLFNAERQIGVSLEIVPMLGWRRGLWYDETGVPWHRPSPNLRTVGQAVLYPGVGSIEATNLSVGRGTDTPFEQVGAPWIDGVALAATLNARGLAGVRFYPVEFTPVSGPYAGERCRGTFLIVANRDLLRPVRLGLEIATAIYRLHPESFEIDRASRLLGSREAVQRIKAGDDPAEIAASWGEGEREWSARVAPYLLYEP